MMESGTESRRIQKTNIKESDSRLEIMLPEFLNRRSIIGQCNEDMLEKLYKAYAEAPDMKMNKFQLYEVFEKILKLPMSIEKFDELYKQMNSMGDKSIKWDELLSYFLLEFQMKKITTPSKKFELTVKGLPKMIKSRHRSFICRINYLPEISNMTMQKNASSGEPGRYITASRDGVINYWTIEFNHQRQVEHTSLQLGVRGIVTDMIVMPDVKIICISSTARNLCFYDSAANKFEFRMTIYNFKNWIVSLNYYYSTGNIKQRSCIIMGDTSGSVKFILFDPKDRGPFKQCMNQDILRIQYDNALMNGIHGFELQELNRIHSNWVSQVNYYGNFHGFISCARCSNCSLFFGDRTGLKMKYSFKVSMGISCFALDEEKQLLFTGGPDCLVRIWNVFLPNKANAILRGHRTTICTILLLNNANAGKLFTLSKDKCIKIWDIVSRVCIQTYNHLSSQLSDHTPISVIYNSAIEKIIIGGMTIAILTCGKITNTELSDGETHTRQITRVLYNPLFKLIVTTGADSRIIIWDPWRARRMIVISNAHDQSTFLNESVHVEITAATFDYSYQLLITGGRDGTLKIWRFNTATCIKSMSIEVKSEVTDIIWLKNRILCVGWNRYITEFADSLNGVYRKSWKKRHTDDILCAAVTYRQTLATGSYNGELVLWYLDTGQPYKLYQVLTPAYRDTYNNEIMKKNTTKDWTELNEDNSKSTFGHMRSVAVRAILFLCSRRVIPKNGSLIVSLDSGLIQLWSHHPAGGFLKAFSAIHIVDDCCLSLATDPVNDFLITGHKEGYIKVWLMKNYGIMPHLQSKINMAALKMKFPFLWNDRLLGRAKRAVKYQPLPMLLSSIKAHHQSINSIEFIPGANLIVSGSSDHTVRLWTLGGRYLSTLGSLNEWSTILPNVPADECFEDNHYDIPSDIKKNASSTTLRILTKERTDANLKKKLKKEQLKFLCDEKGEKSKLYGIRADEEVIEHHKLTSPTRHEYPTLDNSMAYIPVYTHLKTYNLTSIEKIT